MMNGPEKSDSAIVAMKPANKAGAPAAEWAERRAARMDFLQWVRLEADPDVTSFCKRPTSLGGDDAGPLISFWVQRQRTQEFVLLARHDTTTRWQTCPPITKALRCASSRNPS